MFLILIFFFANTFKKSSLFAKINNLCFNKAWFCYRFSIWKEILAEFENLFKVSANVVKIKNNTW